MFAAALMFACAGCEVSIYSTCKRISTKLLRNVTMFLGIIYDVLKCEHLKIIRANQEEVHLQGDEGYRDIRIIQSYPSKVQFFYVQCATHTFFYAQSSKSTAISTHTYIYAHLCFTTLFPSRGFCLCTKPVTKIENDH
jgi:hypothetical protein